MVKMRLARRGRKKLAIYDIVIAPSKAPRDGRFIEKVGLYNPNTNPATITLNENKALDWIMKGAQPTDTVRAILSYKGILYKKHLQVGVIKGAKTQEEADALFAEWKAGKEAKVDAKRTNLADSKAADRAVRLAAEAKVKEARADELRKKELEAKLAETAEEAAAEAAPAEEAAEEAPTAEAAEAPEAAATEEAAAE